LGDDNSTYAETPIASVSGGDDSSRADTPINSVSSYDDSSQADTSVNSVFGYDNSSRAETPYYDSDEDCYDGHGDHFFDYGDPYDDEASYDDWFEECREEAEKAVEGGINIPQREMCREEKERREREEFERAVKRVSQAVWDQLQSNPDSLRGVGEMSGEDVVRMIVGLPLRASPG